MKYTNFTNVKAENFAGNINGNVVMTVKSVALTADTTVTENLINLSSVTASKVLTVNVPDGALFVVANADASNAATVKCSATDTGATLAKSTTGIYYNKNGVATLIK